MPKKGKKTLEVEEVEDDFDFSDEDDLELGDELDGEGDDDDLLLGEEGEDVGEESRLADTDNPFRKDPASYTIFSSITSKRYRNKIKRLANELHEYAELHQTMLRQRLTYEELLEGMMYPGEDLIPVQPLLIKELIECTVADEVMLTRYGVRLFLTNKRLFFLDADLNRVPSLEEAPKEDITGLVLNKIKVMYEVTDDIWYYPVPLTNLKGMSLDIHFSTIANGWIHQKRPWWSIFISLAGFVSLAWALYQHYELQIDVEQSKFAWSGAASVLGPLIFIFFKVFSRSEFHPIQKQERRVTIGAKDPITQTHCVYKLYLDDKYTIIEAKNYLSLMQEYAPHLSGMVLAD